MDELSLAVKNLLIRCQETEDEDEEEETFYSQEKVLKSSSRPLPLLRLPMLARNEVLQYMMPIELLQISMVSAKSKKAVKFSTRKHASFISISPTSNCLLLCFGYRNKSYRDNSIIDMTPLSQQKNRHGSQKCIWRFDGNQVLATISGDSRLIETAYHIGSSWENYQKMVSFISDIFNIWTLSIDVKGHIYDLKNKLIDYPKSYFLGVFLIPNDYVQGYDYNPAEIILPFPSKEILDLRKIHRNFFKSEHIGSVNHLFMLMTFPEIHFLNMKFTGRQVNLFIKKWMQNDYITMITLLVRYVNIQDVIQGLSVTTEKNGRRTIERFEALGVGKCYTIKRSDGVKATIWHRRRTVIMKTLLEKS